MAKKRNEVHEALALHGFPSRPGPGLGFTPEDDVLLARGWPELRVVTDAAVPVETAKALALEALDSVDPFLGWEVPRAVAERYLAGYRVGPCLFTGDGQPPENVEKRARREALIGAPPAIDAALLSATLRETHFQGMGDTYGSWRFAEVLFLYEAFVGTETVARLVVERVLELAADVASWGFAGEKPARTNAAPHHLALVLPALLARSEASVAAELRSALASGPEPDPNATRGPTAYFELLKRIAEPSAPPRFASAELDEAIALRVPDLPALAARVAKQGVLFAPARIAWLLGTEAFAGKLALGGHSPVRLLSQLAPLKDPGVVRLVAHAATQRAFQPLAGAWLTRRASYAEPILKTLKKVERESAAANAALELLEKGAPASSEPLSEDEVEAAITELFTALGAKLRSTKGKRARVSAIKAAYPRYVEIRAAGGYPVPEADFTAYFGDFGLGEFGMLAVEATK